MLGLLSDAALRSIVLGGAAWLSLTLLRVRNPQLCMTAWSVVLIVSMAMPALTPWMRVTIPWDEAASTRLVKITWTNVPGTVLEASTPAERPAVVVSKPNALAPAPARAIDWHLLATGVYVVVGGAMMLRLLIGLTLTWQVARAARPARDDWAAGSDVRVSDIVVVPVTFASTILLPPACAGWNVRKRQAVLLHEASHVAHGDFYLLLLASINRAVFWFNPFAWWLLIRLAELAEAVSDDAAIEGLGDRGAYAEILLDIATNPQRLPAGLAMAQPGTVRQRVRRILSATAVPARIGRRRRVLTAVALVPLGALSAVTIAQRAAPAAPNLAAPLAASAPIDSSPMRLDRYVGQFQINMATVLTVTREGERLFAKSTGQAKLGLLAIGNHEFVDELGDAHLSFVMEGERPAAAVMLREPGAVSRQGARIDAARADQIEAAFARQAAEVADRFRDQTPMPGGKAALRQMIEDLRRSAPSYQRMSPFLADNMRRQLPEIQSMLGALGAPELFFFRGVGPGGYDIYGVKFAHGSGEFRIYLTSDGTIKDAVVHPDGDGTLGGIVDCALEATLKSSRDTAPIKLSLTNRSGADIRLFSLDLDGQRIADGELANGRSMEILTSIERPLVVADKAGQCREVVLPGQLTRVYLIQPLRSGARPGLSAVRRMTPVPGSDEALQQHIDSIRRGAPDFDRMTPEAAAKTREQLQRQQAILTRLGALRAMSFRGVSPTGNDVYEVLFANGSAVWQIALLDEGLIGAVAIGP
jgi:beta-lactamase regulating signal transducer with metallopeptidase domain